MKQTIAPRAHSSDTEPTSCRLPKSGDPRGVQPSDHRDEEPTGQRQRVGQHGHIFREGDRADRIYQVVDGAGHWPHREDAAAVLPEVVRFASEL